MTPAVTRRTPLTSRQAEILAYLRRIVARDGQAPTYREIAGYFGLVSTQGVLDHLVAIERRGYLRRTRRGVVLTSKGAA